MYQAAFITGFITACSYLFFTGDKRDYWAAVCIAMQTLLVYWQIDNLLGIALIYVLAALTFLVFSIKVSGAVLGIVSGLMALLTVAAYFGLIPSAKGAGQSGLETKGVFSFLGLSRQDRCLFKRPAWDSHPNNPQAD